MTTVLVADDHPLFREAIADALRTMFDRVGVLEAGSMTEAIDQVANANDIDLVLLDLRMPGMSGVKGVRTLRRRRPDIPIAVISALDDSMVVQQCFDAGAIGYIPEVAAAGGHRRRDPDHPGRRQLHAGRQPDRPYPGRGSDDSAEMTTAMRCRFELLTNQQWKVLELMAQGLLNKQHRLRDRRPADHGQGARLELVAKARRLAPHPGGHPVPEILPPGLTLGPRLSAPLSAPA